MSQTPYQTTIRTNAVEAAALSLFRLLSAQQREAEAGVRKTRQTLRGEFMRALGREICRYGLTFSQYASLLEELSKLEQTRTDGTLAEFGDYVPTGAFGAMRARVDEYNEAVRLGGCASGAKLTIVHLGAAAAVVLLGAWMLKDD